MRTQLQVALLIAMIAWPCAPLYGQIQLQSRTLDASVSSTAEFLKALKSAPGKALHGMAKFSRIPSEQQRMQLESAGIVILDPFHGNTYRVRVDKRLKLKALESSGLTVRLTLLAPQDRVASSLWTGDFERYVVQPRGEKPGNYVLTPEGNLSIVVRMHRGVPEARSVALLAKHSLSHARRTSETWTAVVARTALRGLAEVDEVQAIGPAPLPLLPENDRTRALLNVDALQTLTGSTNCMVDGVTGKGVQVANFHNEMDLHEDYASRVIHKEIINDRRPHPTHAAGGIAGTGLRSSGVDEKSNPNEGTACQWRGMAPGAQLIGGRRADGANPAVHSNYITQHGMDVSLHAYAISFDGEYSFGDADRDKLIRGDAVSNGNPVPGRLQVMSAGNHGDIVREGGKQKGYFSLTKQGKNMLVVGNWDASDSDVTRHRIDEFSSLGPAHDGRIKPDVVAPGRTVVTGPNGIGGVMSTGYCRMEPDPLKRDAITAWCTTGDYNVNESRRNFYQLIRGTSMSAQATTGVLALVLEQYSTTYGVNLDQQAPLPSTLRGLMIHTARDKVGGPWLPDNADGAVNAFVGPDFVTGWGLIDAQAAVNTVATKALAQGTVTANCQVKTHLFTVPAGTTGSIRLTLAWDDVAGDPNAARTLPKLINDLDLVLIDPSGTKHYPWQLDQKIVDAAGNEIPNESQHCGTTIDVRREFTPTPNPDIANDTIPNGVVPKAKKGGRDHLNNVEVVDAPAMAGTWTAQVSGFRIDPAPQSYSLIGQTLKPFPIHATELCRINGKLCAVLRIRWDLCERHPIICETRISFPPRGGMRIRFADPRQKIVFPLDAVCGHAVDCPVCTGELPCRNLDLHVTTTGPDLRAAVYSSRGRLVKIGAPAGSASRMRFNTRSGEKYFVVLNRAGKTRVDADYNVKLQLR